MDDSDVASATDDSDVESATDGIRRSLRVAHGARGARRGGAAAVSCFKVDSESAGPSPSLPGAAAAAGPATMNRIMMPPRLR